MTREIAGLSEIIDGFDAVLLDQFGVLHDGAAPFPGAVTCVERLHRRGLPLVALTNSGKRAAANAARLARLGFPARLFRAVISSGELARARVVADLAAGALAPGAGVAILSRGDDGGVLDGLGLRIGPPDADETALLLIAGVEPERIDRDAYRRLLAPLAMRGAPAICANPDRMMYVDGGAAFGAGVVAADYEAAGGRVTMVGKPGREMFAAALRALGDPDPARTLMIGDSLAHDIAGARAAGCATLLIRGGVQAGDEGGAAADFSMERLVF